MTPGDVIEADAKAGDGMPRGAWVHPTAIVYPGVILGDGVEIHAYAVVGSPAEHRTQRSTHGVVIGAGTVIREHVVVNAGIDRPTRLGARCYVMHGAHVGHDADVGDDVTLSVQATLGGHVTVRRGANLGLCASVHQGRTIGELAMVGMGAVVTRDVPDYAKAYGSPAKVRGGNVVGMRRAGFDEDYIRDVVAGLTEVHP